MNTMAKLLKHPDFENSIYGVKWKHNLGVAVNHFSTNRRVDIVLYGILRHSFTYEFCTDVWWGLQNNTKDIVL